MQFERRIYLGILVLVIGFIPVIAGSFFALHKVVNEQKTVLMTNAQELVMAGRLRYIDADQSSVMPVYVLTGDNGLLADFERRFEEFDVLITHLIETEKDPGSRELLTQIRGVARQRNAFAAPGIRLRQQGASLADVNDYFNRNTNVLSKRMQGLLHQLVAKETDDLTSAKAHVASTVNWVIGALIGLCLFAVTLAALVMRLFVKMMAQKKSYDEAQSLVLEQELRLSRARRDAVEVVAHDLKNPLATIKMSVEMMLEEIPDATSPEQLREGLLIAHRSSQSMEHLIKDLLDHAKIESGQLLLEKKICSVDGLLDDLIQRFSLIARRQEISLSDRTRVHGLFIDCDLGRIEQVLSNLIGNAIKFTPAHGHVDVEASRRGDQVVIAVQDSGPGIAEELLPHIFDRFWQVRETAKNGNGLGLAIAKGIVDAHGGELRVESERDQGTRFELILDAREAPRSDTRSIHALAAPGLDGAESESMLVEIPKPRSQASPTDLSF